MKVSVLQESLKAGLSLAGRAAVGRFALPVLIMPVADVRGGGAA